MFVKHLFAAAVCAVVVAFSTPAEAALEVTLSAGGIDLLIEDGDANDFDATVNGVIVTNPLSPINVGGWDFGFTVATTDEPGTGSLASLSISSLLITDDGGGATTISVFASADEYTAPSTPPNILASTGATGALTGSPGDSADVSFESTVDGSIVGSGGDLIAFPLDSSTGIMQDESLITSLGGTYDITLLLEAIVTDGSQINFTGNVALSPVPEPATLAVWSLLGLVGFVMYQKKMRSQS